MPSDQESSASSDDELKALRDALRLSPDNLPLRKHVAQVLLGHGYLEEAEKEFRQMLSQSPDDEKLKLQLASAFYQRGKSSEALVIVEDLIRSTDRPARALLLQARLFYRAGDIPHAVEAYKGAIEADSSVADSELAVRLGVTGSPERSAVVEGKVRASWEDEPDETVTEVERPQIDFGQVGGMENLKEEIRAKIIHPLEHPELYQAYGKAAGGGILMYGPPGCGKTHLARATAGEIQAGFIAVGINELLEMWIGQSERNLHEIFDQARSSKPCVLFFDEVDALGASRSDMKQSATRQLINQFLSELDGIKSDNDGVLILAATNAPWHLDSAFRRPGRFDRILFVPPPDRSARSSILRILCQDKPMEEIDYDQLGSKTDNFSGADLKAVVDIAIEGKLREAIQTGTPQPLGTRDLLKATKQVKPSTREWFSTARNYALYSNQGGVYDDILHYLNIKK